MTTTVPLDGPWEEWFALGESLVVPDGVHHPSAFSAVLASAPIDVLDRVVVDAGSGAGLITIAALARGAKHVVAVDLDRLALAATRENVIHVLGVDAAKRLSLLQTDFDQLGMLRAHVVLANPPQRPTAILAGVPVEERHFHTGGGEDGLDAIRSILDVAESSEVITTAAGVLPIDRIDLPRWPQRRLVTTAEAPLNPVWKLAGAGDTGTVNVWSFRREV